MGKRISVRRNGATADEPKPPPKLDEPKAFAIALTREPEGWVVHRLDLPADTVKAYTLDSKGPNPLRIALHSIHYYIEGLTA